MESSRYRAVIELCRCCLRSCNAPVTTLQCAVARMRWSFSVRSISAILICGAVMAPRSALAITSNISRASLGPLLEINVSIDLTAMVCLEPVAVEDPGDLRTLMFALAHQVEGLRIFIGRG